jgi:uncharacterized protein (TIGR03435 family)
MWKNRPRKINSLPGQPAARELASAVDLSQSKFKMRNTIGLTIGVGLLLVTGGAFGQTASKLTFEVASVKPAAPLDMQKIAAAMQSGESPKIGMQVDAGRVSFTYVDLKSLVSIAYKVKPYQVSGPDWMANQRFDIVAKFPTGATRSDIPDMLQALLIERFKLQAHLESKEQPALALVVAKGGPKLTESAEAPVPIDESKPLKPGEMKMDTPDGPIRVQTDPKTPGSACMNMGIKGNACYKMDQATMSLHMDGKQMTMGGFVEMLSQFSQMTGTSGKQIVDLTDLKGHYTVSMDISLAELISMLRAQGMDVPNIPNPGGAAPGAVAASDPSGASTVFGSVQALGLKLENRKAVIDQLIVDRAEKTPTEN